MLELTLSKALIDLPPIQGIVIAPVVEIYWDAILTADHLLMVEPWRWICRNMYSVLACSDRDALTGLFNNDSR